MTKILTVGKEGIYNVGGTSLTSIANLAQEIGRISGADVVFPDKNQNVPGAPVILNLDLSKSQSEFNKFDYIDLTEGINRTFKWQSIFYGT
jgi:nucleoside-diphosphate-sugar epimerase